MTTPEPPVSRRQFGAELRRLREAAGLQQADVAEYLGTSPTRISRMESGKGRVVAKRDEVHQLCELFKITDERQIQRLVEMVTTSLQPGYWDEYRDVLPSGLEVLFSMESAARSVRTWEPKLVPGLLQTEDYARAVIGTSPAMRPQDVDDMVALRMRRQQAVSGAAAGRPLDLWAIMDEDVLTRPVGGPATMRAQIAHLLAMAEHPHIVLQVVPRSKGAHPGLGGAFTLLDFESSESPVVYADTIAGNLYLEKRAQVRQFTTRFDLLMAAALDPHESAALMRDLEGDAP